MLHSSNAVAKQASCIVLYTDEAACVCSWVVVCVCVSRASLLVVAAGFRALNRKSAFPAWSQLFGEWDSAWFGCGTMPYLDAGQCAVWRRDNTLTECGVIIHQVSVCELLRFFDAP